MVRVAAALVASFILTASAGAFAQQPAPAPAAPAKDPTWKQEDPAKAADPPLIPAPAKAQPESPPLSTSGTDVQPAGPSTSTTPTPIVVDDQDEVARREARMKALEDRVAADERRLRRLDERTKIWKHLRLEGFVQPQFLLTSYNTAASPNLQANGQLPEGINANDVVAKPDGSTTNGTFFRLRRTRLRTFYETDAMRLFIQIDVLPVGGIGSGLGTIVRNAEATGIVHWSKDVRTEVTAGLFFTPFRHELLEISMTRPFIERTWFIQNAFPVERDIGVQARTYAMGDRLQFDIGIINGQRLGEKYFIQTPDLNKSKDLVSFITYRLGSLTLGVNGYLGRGQNVDAQNLRFKQFQKWAVNYQAIFRRTFLRRLGETRLLGELAIAQNMDTGVNYAFAVPQIPTNLSDDASNLDERALYLRAEQDLSPWLMAGYRYDFYSPDTAIKNNARDTHAFLAVVRFSPNLRWMNELGWAIDNVHAPNTPPPSKHIVTFSSVLQASFQ